MEFPYIKDGNIYDTNDKLIEKPSVLIIGKEVVGYGTYGFLEYKSRLERRKLVLSGKSVSSVNLIPLYEKLNIYECLNVIKMCIVGEDLFEGTDHSYDDFLKDLCKLGKTKSRKFTNLET